PAMAYQALRHDSDRDITFRFVSNVDPTDISEAVRDLASGRFDGLEESFVSEPSGPFDRLARDRIRDRFAVGIGRSARRRRKRRV
ncbi:MAG TPA: hypothetical protein PLY73_16275, partial [Candidatus Ozemobacteraceae bacterium]|nr:hypothetical protein [Candidatus Ozemobacteraceae bacterium]